MENYLIKVAIGLIDQAWNILDGVRQPLMMADREVAVEAIEDVMDQLEEASAVLERLVQ